MISLVPHKEQNLMWLEVQGRCPTECDDSCQYCQESSIALSNWIRFAGVSKVVLDFERLQRPNMGFLLEILMQAKRAKKELVLCAVESRILEQLKLRASGYELITIKQYISDVLADSQKVYNELGYEFGEPLDTIPPMLQRSK